MPRLRLTAIDEGYSVVISTRLTGADSPHLVMQSIINLFPDFAVSLPDEPEYPSNQDEIIAAKDVSLQTFLEIIHNQSILDTALDCMSANLDINGTVFNISRQAALAGKVAFPLPGDSPLGGVITVEIEGQDLGDWLEAATWHSGRENIPRRIGDEFSMSGDGDAVTWH